MVIGRGGCLMLGSFTLDADLYHLKADGLFKAKDITMSRKNAVLEGRVQASNFLNIVAEHLVLNGASIPRPDQYSIQVDHVEVIRYHPDTQWLVDLIQNENGKNKVFASEGEFEVETAPSIKPDTPSGNDKRSDLEEAFYSSVGFEGILDRLFELPAVHGEHDSKNDIRVIFNPKGHLLTSAGTLDQDPLDEEVVVFSNTFLTYLELEDDFRKLTKTYFGEKARVRFIKLNSLSRFRMPEPNLFGPVTHRSSEFTMSTPLYPAIHLDSISYEEMEPYFYELFSHSDVAQKTFYFKSDGKAYLFRVLHNPQQKKLRTTINARLEGNGDASKAFTSEYENKLVYCTNEEVTNLNQYKMLEQITLEAYKKFSQKQSTLGSVFDGLKALLGLSQGNKILSGNGLYQVRQVNGWIYNIPSYLFLEAIERDSVELEQQAC